MSDSTYHMRMVHKTAQERLDEAAAQLAAKDAENKRLREALVKMQGILDGCKNVPNPGPCGMTLEAQQRHSTYLRVPGEIMLIIEGALYDTTSPRAALTEEQQ